MMGARRVCLRVDLKGALRRSDKYLGDMFCGKNGEKVTGLQVRHELQSMVNDGIHFIPAGDCSNWNTEKQQCDGHPPTEDKD